LYLGGARSARKRDSSSSCPISGSRVELDARLSLLTLAAAFLFLWPLLVYGRPAYIQDSAAYYKGGRAAVTFVLDKIERRDAVSPVAQTTALTPASPAASAGPQAPNDGKPEVHGARAVSYSLAAYIFGAPNAQMWLLAAVQALAAGFACAVTLLLFGGSIRGLWWRLAALAVATPVAFVSCLVIPDIFAGIVVLLITLLATAYQKLSGGVRTVSVVIAAAGIAFHASHLPIGLGMTVTAMAWMAWLALRKSRLPHGQWALVAAPFLLGATATVILNFAAFGGPSLTGKRYPLTLARSVAEGPGKWYLEKNCAHLRYAICEVYPHGVPGTISTFLWGSTGVKERATPEQMDRIRTEESDVVLAATRAYPLMELRLVAVNFARQLFLFSPGVGLENRIVVDSNGDPQLAPATYDRTWVTLVHLLSVAGVIAAIVLLYRRFRADRSIGPMIALVFAGIVFNDAVCTYFSGVTDRYEARVIWLVPLLALAMLARNERRGGAVPDASPA
jgi:hypothetical protein